VLNQVADLDRVFQALADPGRRLMLDRLSQGSASVSELGNTHDSPRHQLDHPEENQ